jgi:hypothetical protein
VPGRVLPYYSNLIPNFPKCYKGGKILEGVIVLLLLGRDRWGEREKRDDY